jgi:SagB-type dehydrogenase family enzyme
LSSVYDKDTVALPEPRYDSDVPVEKAILKRRSIRDYTGQALALSDVSQLLWAAQGIIDPSGSRAAPSAGATYPLEVYVVIGNVKGVAPGIYKYQPEGHQLLKVVSGDKRQELAETALSEQFVAEAAIDIVVTAIYERTMARYGERGIRYVQMEVGHAAQNVSLQAVALNLGTVVVGAFDDDQVKEVLNLPDDEVPLYIIPVGRAKD